MTIQNCFGREVLSDKCWDLYAFCQSGMDEEDVLFSMTWLKLYLKRGRISNGKGLTVQNLIGRKDRGDLGLLHMFKMKRLMALWVKREVKVSDDVCVRVQDPDAFDVNFPSDKTPAGMTVIVDKSWVHNITRTLDKSALEFSQELFNGELDSDIKAGFAKTKEVDVKQFEAFFESGEALPNWLEEFKNAVKEDKPGPVSLSLVSNVDYTSCGSLPSKLSGCSQLSEADLAEGVVEDRAGHFNKIALQHIQQYVTFKEMKIQTPADEFLAKQMTWPIASYNAECKTNHLGKVLDLLVATKEVEAKPWAKVKKYGKDEAVLVKVLVKSLRKGEVGIIFCVFKMDNYISILKTVEAINKE